MGLPSASKNRKICADFMADFVAPPPAGMGKASELWIGPPADGGEEGDPVNQTYNPTFEGHKTSRAADIWALGIILYQLVYGHTP